MTITLDARGRRGILAAVADRRAVAGVAGIGFAWFLLGHWDALSAGVGGLGAADPVWLALAVGATAALTVAAALSVRGSLGVRVPFGTLCAVQLAASFPNQLLPAGTGAMAINLRFLRRQGLTGPGAAATIGLNQAAGVVIRALLLVAVLLTEPAEVGLPDPTLALGVVLAMTLIVGVAAVGLSRRGSRRGAAAGRLAGESARLRGVLRNPSRAAALWSGSAATPLLQAFGFCAVARAVGVEASLWHLATLYLAASTVAALIPTPGGLGALDLALVAALVGAGVPSPAAAATAVGFRLITAWLPLLPGGVTLVVLARRQLI
jgi:uncharacterized membrane protein YbhN (UPF0104 family)